MKDFIQKIINNIGYDIWRRDARLHPEITNIKLAKDAKCEWIIDIGANVGQYGLSLREFNYKGNILSFEPLSEAHRRLSFVASADPRWTVAKRCALGAVCGTSKINISKNSVSSSLLDMNSLHRTEAPNSKYIDCEDTEVCTLDSLIDHYLKPNDLFILKIDTQGYEKEVITGSLKSMQRCIAIQMEINLKPLYASNFLLEDAMQLMKSLGYGLYSITPGFSNPESGQTFQIDGTFVKID